MSFRVGALSPDFSKSSAAFEAVPVAVRGYEIAQMHLNTSATNRARYFSNKTVYASAANSDLPQPSHTAALQLTGHAKLEEMRQRGELTPRIEDGGTLGGVRWNAFFEGLLIGKPVAPHAGSYSTWHSQGLSLRQSQAPKVLADAALETSDWYPLLAGLGAAPKTAGLSLLAGGLMVGATIFKKSAKPLAVRFDAQDLSVVGRRLTDYMSKEVVLEQRLVRWRKERLELMADTLKQQRDLFKPEAAARIDHLLYEAYRSGGDKEKVYAQMKPLFAEVAAVDQLKKVNGLDEFIETAVPELAELTRRRQNLEVSFGIVKEGLQK